MIFITYELTQLNWWW